MRDQHAKDIEVMIQNVQGQAVQRGKELKESLDAEGRGRSHQLAGLLVKHEKDRNEQEQLGRTSGGKTKRDEAMPAGPGDVMKTPGKGETEPSVSRTMVLRAQQQALREKRHQIAQKVSSC